MNKAVLELVPTSSDLRGGRLEATKELLGTTVKTSKAVAVQFEIYLHYEQDMGHESWSTLASEDMRLVFDKN